MSEKSDKNFSYSEFEIKKKSGKVRKIVNPNKALKKWQRGQLKNLIKAFLKLEKEANLFNTFHGFIPKRNGVTAAEQQLGYKALMMFDISNFFDNVTDIMVRNSYPNFTTKYHPDKQAFFFHKDGYTAQGFPTSPLLCNIVLIPIIKELKTELSYALGASNFNITMYADDLGIGLKNPTIETETLVKSYVTRIFTKHGLDLNHNKTRTKYLKFGSIRYLGVNITENGILPTRKTNRKVRALRHQAKTDKTKHPVLKGYLGWQSCSRPKKAGFAI